MIACAITWSIGSVTRFFDENENRRALLALATTTNTLQHEYYQSIENPSSRLETSPQEEKQVYFLKEEQLHINDPFSATWLQPLDKFMKVNTSNINTVEDGCFEVFRTSPKAVRMTLDWLDFSVEHMSKWWKVTNVFGQEDAIPFHRAVTAFQAYTRSITPLFSSSAAKSPLQATFAIVAFQSYEDDAHDSGSSTRGRPLTVSSLAATIASLVKVGFGRVVVAGMSENDESIVQETFRFLQETFDPDRIINSSELQAVTAIGPMEVGFVRLSEIQVQSRFIKTNIPKGALHVLQEGFKGTLDHDSTIDLFGTTTDKSHWQYIYLTEPDIILQTRKSAIPQLKRALDQGFVLAPHRLQPIPHETDFFGLEDQHKIVPNTGKFSLLLNLDSDGTDATCCDEQAGKYKPWQDYEDCGVGFWWQCGFSHLTNYSHKRLEPYSLIRLKGGTGIVSLAASEHGRRCFPSRHGVCTPTNELNSTTGRAWYG
jgi:hypothetical protein